MLLRDQFPELKDLGEDPAVPNMIECLAQIVALKLLTKAAIASTEPVVRSVYVLLPVYFLCMI